MLPPPLDAEALRGRCDAFGDMKSAREVGGDLFDLALLDGERLALVIGDVCGKGVPASLFMCATVTALRLAARNESDLGRLIEQANDALCALNAASMFTTLFYGVLNLADGRLDYVNCGHNPPLLLERGAGSRELEGHGPPLGFFPGQRWTTQSVQLRAGEGVFLFTDGVTECFNPTREEYGEARLANGLGDRGAATAQQLVEKIFAHTTAFADGAEQSDDITCVAAFFSAK
jgi:serine phosphatase RsbU (regulator of sigma subunit)